jgi:hypothetical protein
VHRNLAEQPAGQFRGGAVIDVARRELKRQQLALIDDNEVELETRRTNVEVLPQVAPGSSTQWHGRAWDDRPQESSRINRSTTGHAHSGTKAEGHEFHAVSRFQRI